MRLYHVTTERKARLYRQTGAILPPVRGFDSLMAAMAWAMKTGRKVIYSTDVDGDTLHLLPDHHNDFGRAWWWNNAVPMERVRCEYSAGGAIPKEDTP